jgi:hypothetical protein
MTGILSVEKKIVNQIHTIILAGSRHLAIQTAVSAAGHVSP